MAVLEDLLQGARDWLKTAVPTLSDAQIIPANDKGPRPALPYLTVLVTTADLPTLVRDERIGGAPPDVFMRGFRRATLSVQGFGVATHEWLTLAAATLGLPTVQAQLDASGFSVVPLSAITDISALVDTAIEQRYSRDFDLTYLVETDPETQVEWLVGELDLTLIHRDGDPDPLVATLTTE